MTKQDLQKELKEKVKEGVKPSDIRKLKRSKSLGDIPTNPPQEKIFYEASEDNPAELKARISELEDQILQLRISKLKDFSDYWEKNKELKKDLESNIDYGIQEIERLENKLRTINKKRLELQDQLSQSQSKNAKLEIKLINAENKEAQTATPHSDF
ncbi:32442_t:CDS:1 [Racocetra persica]|uniref:32442_t:CDS:1 n=1 Tax=Racocetra persica TaxID=160502 RepID=A0ACA9L4D0_9GLOM|nr:32442_t:CDS:1 [Racocetra persica]